MKKFFGLISYLLEMVFAIPMMVLAYVTMLLLEIGNELFGEPHDPEIIDFLKNPFKEVFGKEDEAK